jgi:hypothetical protein
VTDTAFQLFETFSDCLPAADDFDQGPRIRSRARGSERHRQLRGAPARLAELLASCVDGAVKGNLGWHGQISRMFAHQPGSQSEVFEPLQECADVMRPRPIADEAVEVVGRDR